MENLSRSQPPARIVFTGDFLRLSPTADRPTQHHNIRWLRNLVSTQIRIATGLEDGIVGCDYTYVRDGGLTFVDVERIYSWLGMPLSIHSWAAIHALNEMPRRVDQLFRYLFDGSLVIGFEMAPYLEAYCTRNDTPFVNFTVHPVRFLDDILLGLRSNVPEVQEKLFERRINEDYIRTISGVQKAGAARYFKDGPKKNSALFLMQTWYDQSQIRNGVFVGPSEHLDEIAKIAAEHEEFLIKEHPLEPNPQTPLLQARIPNVRMVKHNVYGYLSIPEIRTVATLSSSVGVEAEYFGKISHTILGSAVPLRRSCVDAKSGFVGIESSFLAPDFWRDVLEPLMPVTRKDGVEVPYKPNRLRTAMRSFWNFNEIDTDIAVSMAR